MKTIFHDDALVTDHKGPANWEFARKVREAVRELLKKHGADTVTFGGKAAEQWNLAQVILDEMSRASARP